MRRGTKSEYLIATTLLSPLHLSKDLILLPLNALPYDNVKHACAAKRLLMILFLFVLALMPIIMLVGRAKQ